MEDIVKSSNEPYLIRKFKEMPGLGKVLLFFYGILLILQGVWILGTFVSHEEDPGRHGLLRALILNHSNIWGLAAVLVINIACIALIYAICYRSTKKGNPKDISATNPESVQGHSEFEYLRTLIVTDEHPEHREKMFKLENSESIKHTYYVYGIKLTQLSDKEELIKTLVTNNVEVKLCIANPNIFKNVVCDENATNNYCYGMACLAANGSNIDSDKLKKHITDNLDTDLLRKYNAVLNVESFQKYVDRVIDYRRSIETSIDNFKKIISTCGVEDDHGKISLRKTNSFIPLSISIIDQEEENGWMIIEYFLPFSNKRLMLHIEKNKTPQSFQAFCRLYNKIYDLSEEGQIISNKQP